MIIDLLRIFPSEVRKQKSENRIKRNYFLSSVICYLSSFCCFRKQKNKGFTLIEVMVATVVLVVGVVVIFESFLLSLDALAVFNNRLNAQWFFSEKIWQVQNNLDQPIDSFLVPENNGVLQLGTEKYIWTSSLSIIDPMQGLYSLSINLSWQQGNRKRERTTQTMVKSYFNNSTAQIE